jgi:hypothetical protein
VNDVPIYLQALFSTLDAASGVKDRLLHLDSIQVHRAFVIRRGHDGYRVEGRFHGERPDDRLAIFFAAMSRLFHRTSHEEDSIAIDDAERELAVGQSALVALIDEPPSQVENATDNVIHEAGGTIIRVAPGTLDAEAHERFFAASALTDTTGEPDIY